jgi:signal peptidase II
VDITHQRRKNLTAFVVAAAAVLAISQLGSYIVHTRLPLNDTYVVSSNLHFTHVRNTGAIFGVFPGNSLVFAFTSCLVVAGLCVYLLRNAYLDFYHYICFGFIVGAATSNMCDRLLYGAVIDFIYVVGIPHWSYVFNIADAAIHLGIWPLFILMSLRRTPDGHGATTQAAGGE